MNRKKTVAACYCVFDDDEWLPYSLASIYDAVDAIYFLVANAPWNGPMTDNRKTLECIASFPDPQKKIVLRRGDWTNEVEQRNFGLAMVTLDGFDWLLIIDADEIYDNQVLERMIRYTETQPQVTCWHCWFIHYWKSPQYRIDPPENHHPPVLLRTNSGGFVEYRNLQSFRHELMPAEVGFVHHMSYARTDQQIKRKITSFSHSHQINPDWYEKVWKAWDNDQSITDLCPYNPGVFQRAVPVPAEVLPAVVKQGQTGPIASGPR